MNIERLEIFQKVAEMKNFTKAGYELNLSQSSISKHIKVLEEYYDTKLFDRKGKGIELTEAGIRLLTFTKDIINLSKEAEQTMKQVKMIEPESLIIQTEQITGEYLLTGLISNFRKEYPNISVVMNIKINIEEIHQNVLKDTVHLGFSGLNINDPSLICLPSYSEELLIMVGNGHPWAQIPPKSLNDFSNQIYVVYQKAPGINNVVKNKFLKNGINIGYIIETPDLETFYRMIGSDNAVSIVPQFITKVPLMYKSFHLKTFRIPEIEIKRYVYFIYKKNNPSLPLKKFLYFLGRAKHSFLEINKNINNTNEN